MGRVAITKGTAYEAKDFVRLTRDVVIVVSPVKIGRYDDTKVFVRIGHRELMFRAVGSGAAGKAMASPLFAVTCRMYTQPLLVPRTCTNVYRILA